jgi:hypothetical protein
LQLDGALEEKVLVYPMRLIFDGTLTIFDGELLVKYFAQLTRLCRPLNGGGAWAVLVKIWGV